MVVESYTTLTEILGLWTLKMVKRSNDTLYGKPKDKKWWMELRRNRMSDVKAEFSS
jgi:hypothetical protein